MPNHPPPHLAEPASPLLLDQDLAQATAEAHAYVRHIERYSALAARAAERVRDDACFCTRFLQLGPNSLCVSEHLRKRRSHTSSLAACAMHAHTMQGAHMPQRARVRHQARSSSPGTQGAGCELLAACEEPRLTLSANTCSAAALRVELTALAQRGATGWVSAVVALCRGTSACSVRSLCCCLQVVSRFPHRRRPTF